MEIELLTTSFKINIIETFLVLKRTIDGSESDRHSTFASNSSTLRGLLNLVLTLFKGSVSKVSVTKGCLSGSLGGSPNPGKGCGCGGITRGGGVTGVVKVRPKQSLKLELMRPPMPMLLEQRL
eukprot:scaffold33396_cov45-Attheya_sp.AAC.3